MKNLFKFMILALVAMCGFASCSEECDHDIIDVNVDYSESVIGCWDISGHETISELLEICTDGTFNTLGSKNGEIFVEEGTWTLSNNRLVLTTDEGKIHFSGTITVYPEDVMLMTADGSSEPLVYHYWVELPFPTSLVGTWTCLDADFAEVLTIRENSMMTITRLQGDSLVEEMPGQFLDSNGGDGYGMAFGDGTYRWGKYEVVSGELLVLTDLAANTRRLYYYCKEDLSEEIVGMWVCNDGRVDVNNDMMIQTFNEDGSLSYTGYAPLAGGFTLNGEGTYKVIGDLLILKLSKGNLVEDAYEYVIKKLIYSPMGTTLGDIITFKGYYNEEESTTSWLRIKQSLALEGNKYDYIKTFVTNVSGEDKDIPFLNTSFNFAKMDGSIIDKFLKSTLFAVEFPSADTLRYSFLANGQNTPMSAPIEVEGNKMTIKMSANGAAYHDVELYAFQDQDNTQMHLYMPTASFEKFFANTSVFVMLGNGQLTENDTDAIANVYKNVADAVHSINLSLVMSKSK